jgi:Membrane carboxypeptidase (penicillin-binding protein)
MNDSRNQRPVNNPPPRKSGLLSNYKNQVQDSDSQNDAQWSRPGVPPSPSVPPVQLPAQSRQPGPPGPMRTHSSLLKDYSQSPMPPEAVPPQQAYAAPPQYIQHSQSAQRPPSPQPMMPQQPPVWTTPPPAQSQGPASGYGNVGGPSPYQQAWRPQPSPAPVMAQYRAAPPSMGPGGISASGFEPWRRSLPVRLSRQKRQRRGKGKGSGPRRVVAAVLISFLVLILLSTLGGSAYAYNFYQQQLPLMEKYANKQISQNTRIYDRNGVLLYEVYSQGDQNQQGRRVAVRYADIPQIMQDAMISIEDKNFWTNEGVDPLAIVRAGTSTGGGASTLTQQLIKNLSNNDQQTYQRKISEAAMAIGLTQNYSKAKIMEMYFNVAPFGSNTYGVEVAAEDLFGLKPVCQVGMSCVPGLKQLEYNQKTKQKDPILGLARASLLAAIPNNPSRFDPTLGKLAFSRVLERQKLVLENMISQGRLLDGAPITPAVAQKAEALTAKMTFKPYARTRLAPHFVDYVINQVEAALGDGDMQSGAYKLMTGGYNIRTTIDVNLVDYAQRAIYRHLYMPDYQKYQNYVAVLSRDSNVNNAAVVVMDAKNGEVLAMVGSADYKSNDPKVNGQFNAAVSARPPGSTFKPFEYATAFEMGWTPGINLQDIRTYFPNGARAGTTVKTSSPDNNVTANNENEAVGIYSPSDYNNSYWNRVFTNRMATANSFNIAAIRAMQFTGQQAVLDTVRRMGITGLKANGLSLAIGSQDVSPLQMAGAYQTFANGGQHIPPQTILDIWDNYGNSLYRYDENHPPASRVLSPQVSYMMTSVLIDEPSRNIEFSNIHDLSFADMDYSCTYNVHCSRQVAAKTGTTDNFADNWTIGYTPDVVVAVWAGNSDDSAMKYVIGITGAAPIWHSVMERTLGACNYATPANNDAMGPDDIQCGPNYKFRFSQNPQWTFPIPAGMSQGMPAGYTSTIAASDWMLNN